MMNTFFTRVKLCLGAILILVSSCNTHEEITMQSLLDEMTDRSTLASWPEEEYVLKQFSSYDRSSVTSDSASWFANWDRSQFIREEMVDGRKEYVAFDAEGPGAITRFWVTVAGYSNKGILRIYIDDAKEPVIEGEVLSLISGGTICEAPLSESVSKLTKHIQRGHNLYLPIPYAKRCKVTYESPSLKEAGINSGENFYYNINYRTYSSRVKVKSFSKEQLKMARQAIQNANKLLKEYPVVSDHQMYQTSLKKLVKGDVVSTEIKDNAAIRKLSVHFDAEDISQALRSLILKISFDGIQTVWAPVGDFFGTGNRLKPYCTFFTEVTSNNTLSCYWVMPFKNGCKVTLENVGEQDVTVDAKVYTSKWNWNRNSMYFGSSWHQHTKIHTGEKRSMEGCFDQKDLNFVTLFGQGIYVGDGVTLFNTAADWWGEGDEKIYVDGENFPSHFGTGTEDYYGYAWCMHNPFDHPFIAQPDGDGATNIGHVVNLRYRTLDAIPFKKSLKMDLELWHWASTLINYAPITYYYMLPGGTSNQKPEPAIAALPIAKNKSDIISPDIDKNGRIEAEHMKIELSHGVEKTQKVPSLKFSNHSQFFWQGARLNDEAKLIFVTDKGGDYTMQGQLTKAGDYGIVNISLNGKLIRSTLDCYSPKLKTESVNFGTVTLKEGINELSVKVVGRNTKSANYLFGLDYLQFND